MSKANEVHLWCVEVQLTAAVEPFFKVCESYAEAQRHAGKQRALGCHDLKVWEVTDPRDPRCR